MTMVEVNIADLVRPALDWAVATIEGLPIRLDPMGFGATENGGYWVWDGETYGEKRKIGREQSKTNRNECGYYSPSTSWEQLGPLILKYPIVLGNHESGDEDGSFWGSAHCFRTGTNFKTHEGIMVATCRAIVAFKLGGGVMLVPSSLIQAAA